VHQKDKKTPVAAKNRLFTENHLKLTALLPLFTKSIYVKNVIIVADVLKFQPPNCHHDTGAP